MVLDQLFSFIDSLSLAEAQTVLEPLLVFIITMTIYAIFVFKFYKFLARRDVFRLSKGDNSSTAAKIGYALEYLFLFPLLAFFWFLVISILLSILSEILFIGNVFMAAMATMATIRLSAYYDEDLSRDIAKLIPFALLAVFLLDITSLSLDAPFQVIREIPTALSTLVYYFVFIVVLEFLLRIATHGRKKSGG